MDFAVPSVDSAPEEIGRLNYRIAAIMPMQWGSLDDLLEERGALGERETARLLLAVAEPKKCARESAESATAQVVAGYERRVTGSLTGV
jgi:hypothetical protein